MQMMTEGRKENGKRRLEWREGGRMAFGRKGALITAYLIDQFAYGRNQFGTVIDVLLLLAYPLHGIALACSTPWCCWMVDGPLLHHASPDAALDAKQFTTHNFG
jgi:hypothetical protein